MKRINTGFTLIELIVVITILAVLGTIAFLSFQSYTVYARDSVRISNLRNLESGLQIQYTKGGYYAVPDDFVSITASGTLIRQQGVFGPNSLRTIQANTDASKDPLTEQYYDYITDAYQSEYQLIGYMEGEEVTNSKYLPQTFASTGTTMRTMGQDLGVVSTGGLDLHRNPANIGQDFEIANTSTEYMITFNSDSEITGTGQTLITVLGAYDKALGYLDPSLTLYYDMETMIQSGSLVLLKDFSSYGNYGNCYEGSVQIECSDKQSGPQVGSMTNGGQGMTFDGVNDWIRIVGDQSINESERTIIILSKNGGGASYRLLNQKFGGAVAGNITFNDFLTHFNLSTFFRSLPSDDRNRTCGLSVGTSQWNHLSYVHIRKDAGSSGMKTYHQGEEYCEHDGYSTIFNNWYNWHLYLGTRDLGDSLDTYGEGGHPQRSFWEGEIDDIKIYNRALSNTEIQAIYGSTLN